MKVEWRSGTVQILHAIMEAGEQAAACTEHDADRATFLEALRAAAAELGAPVAEGADVVDELKESLRELFRQAAEAQAAANAATPRDAAGGVRHGANRGYAENALYWIDRALGKLEELRAFEARRRARSAS